MTTEVELPGRVGSARTTVYDHALDEICFTGDPTPINEDSEGIEDGEDE